MSSFHLQFNRLCFISFIYTLFSNSAQLIRLISHFKHLIVMAIGNENAPTSSANFVSNSLKLLYQVRGEAITKHPEYIKAVQLLSDLK